jgi:uncharacterized membrane protein YkoI
MGRLARAASIATLLLWQGGAIADEDHERVYELRQAGDILSLEKILEISRQRMPGKVIEVELEREDGKLIYELEILDEQYKVWKLEVDAVKGDVLRVEED